MKALITWLKSLFIKPKQGNPQMSEPLNDGTAVVEQDQPAQLATDHTDAVLVKLKELLKVAGHDVEAVFDDVVALAKKLV